MTGPADKQLVRECLSGDSSAFGALVVRYQEVIYNAALRMVGGEDDARDIAQTVFVKAYEKLDSFNPKFAFFSWLYRITVNESINFMKQQRRLTTLDENIESDEPDPESASAHAELSAQISSALLELTWDYRLVIVMRHFVDLTYQEMSEVLQVPEKKIKSRLFSARRRLSDILAARNVNLENFQL